MSGYPKKKKDSVEKKSISPVPLNACAQAHMVTAFEAVIFFMFSVFLLPGSEASDFRGLRKHSKKLFVRITSALSQLLQKRREEIKENWSGV